MPNAKDYKATRRNFLVYGRPGSGKSSALLTHPGKKFVYIFDPSGLETFAGHDVEYEMYVPTIMNLKKSKLGKESNTAVMIRPDPNTYEKFEQDFETRIKDGFFDAYDLIGFESATTLLELIMWYILDKQGRGNSAPEIADYFYRADGFANLIRTATALDKTVFCSAHLETSQDEVTKRIETTLAIPPALQNRLPLLFSEVLPVFAETDEKTGTVKHFVQMAPTRRMPSVRHSLKGMKPQMDITIDWSKPPEGQGLFGLYMAGKLKTPEELRAENRIRTSSDAPKSPAKTQEQTK